MIRDAMNRRSFLKTGLAAGAGLAMVPNLRANTGSGGSNTLNVALVGAGKQGRVLINAMLQIPDVRFRAVCDVWSYNQGYGARYLTRYGHPVNAYADFQEMLDAEPDLDAVIIATPDWVHAPQTIAALNAGLHVYCEKMMSNSVEEARHMVQASQSTGKLLQIGHQRRSNPRYLHAYALAHEHGIFGGPFTHANAQWNRSVTPPLRWPARFEMDQDELDRFGYESMNHLINWRWFKQYGGGPISDLGAHNIDIFNWFFNAHPRGVIASGGIDYYKDYELMDNVMAIYDYETPAGVARAFYQVLTTTGAMGYHERFMGVEGTLSISEDPHWNQAYREKKNAPDWDEFARQGLVLKYEGLPATPDGTEVDSDVTPGLERWDLPVKLEKTIHQPHLENFFDAIRHGTPLTCPGETGLATTVTVLRINQAVESACREAFQPGDFTV